MLELRTYSLAELSAVIGTRGKQATDRKLESYGIEYILGGERQNATYTITAIPNPFKCFCVFELGFDPHTDFIKLRDFLAFLLKDPDFDWRPMEMMEEYTRTYGDGISRQTIAKYLKKLQHLELINLHGDVIYFRVYKHFGVQKHEVVTKEEYSKAWGIYWDKRREGYDSRAAYSAMYNFFHGVPRKQHKIEKNGIHAAALNLLSKLVADDFLDEKDE